MIVVAADVGYRSRKVVRGRAPAWSPHMVVLGRIPAPAHDMLSSISSMMAFMVKALAATLAQGSVPESRQERQTPTKQLSSPSN